MFCTVPPSLPPSFSPRLSHSLFLLPLDPLSLSLSFYYSLEEFNLDDHDIDANTTGLMNDCSSKTHTQPVNDFGHSLFAGYIHTYNVHIYRYVLYTHL